MIIVMFIVVNIGFNVIKSEPIAATGSGPSWTLAECQDVANEINMGMRSTKAWCDEIALEEYKKLKGEDLGE